MTDEQAKPRPFLKWCGSKRQLLPELLARIPKTWNHETDLYIEPFVGAGALFWELRPARAILNDANEEVMNLWRCLASPAERTALFQELSLLRATYVKRPKWTFDYTRAINPADHTPAFRAARMLFLNKTCFNGLYRVNAAGGFNVPWGKNPKACVFDEPNLSACAAVLGEGRRWFGSGDFADVIMLSGEITPRGGELIYADPPYVPVSPTSNFQAYTVDGFKYVDQLRLVQYAVWLRDCGCHVMLSQAADEILIDQYRRCGFKCDLVSARRNVNSKGDKRGPIDEYIIYGGK
jgi:DNA adenine methylase